MTRWLLLVFAALLAAPAAAKERADRYSAMTYNIRLDLASDGDNAWPHRRAALTGLIAYYAPDLVGMQEVLPHQKLGVEADLPGYEFVGVARDDGKDKGEFSPVGFRRDRFALIASGTFWLSPTPQVPGKGWDAAYPRVASWARQIRRWIESRRKPGEAVVLMGDFNSPTDSPAYTAITAAGPGALRDTLTISRTPHFGPLGTFTAFKIEQVEAAPIDHIFVSNGVTVLRHATLTQQSGGRLPSDHYPVLADLCVGKGC